MNFTCVLTPEKPAEVSIDVLKVTEIVNNLLSNAIKFTPEGGSVKLSLDASKETPNQLLCDIVVEDTGIGMLLKFKKRDEVYAYLKSLLGKYSSMGGVDISINVDPLDY